LAKELSGKSSGEKVELNTNVFEIISVQ